MATTHLFLLIFPLLFLAAALNAEVLKKIQCERGPLDVVFLVDTNDFNNTIDFNKQRSKIIDIIRYLKNISVERDISYSVIEFHRNPVILLPILSPFASQPAKVVDYIKTLESRTKFDSSPARALELAAKQFINSSRVISSKLIILAHDGISTDLIAETLEAKNNLERIGVKLFAITSTTKPNLPALVGYTTNRRYVYVTESDRDVFYEEMKRAADPCAHISGLLDGNITINNATFQEAIAFEIRGHKAKEAQLEKKLSLERICKANKVDLMVVLDSSGSVFNAFEGERRLVHDLINSLAAKAIEDGRIQVSVVRFASSAEIVIPSKINQTPNEIIGALDKIKFTGGGTRIASAIDLTLADLSRWRRSDAIQILILISDGNGQELWHVVQTAGKKLQNANVEVFAVPISRDYNLNELTLYTGDVKRIYLGAEQNQFVSIISFLINECVRATNLSQPYVTIVTKPKSNVPQSDSISSVKTKAQILREHKEEASEKLLAEIESFSKANLNLTTFANSLDDLNSPIDMISMSKARGIGLLANSEGSAKLERNLEKELIKNKPIEKESEENITVKISPQDGYFDLLFAINLSPDSSTDLKNQLKLMTELINKVTDEDINEERIRIAVVTFTEEARLHLEWGNATTKTQILQHFESIKYTVGNPSTVTGITFATQYARKFRRSNARLIIILASNGNTQDLWHSIMQAAKKLYELQETITYALTTSKQYAFNVLEAFTKDKWKIYVDGRTRRFVTDASKEFLKKVANENGTFVDIISSPIIKSIQNHNDFVDLIILMDKSTAADDDFEASKRFLEELIRNIDFKARIRISLITFTDNAHIEIELRKPITKENVLYTLEKLQNEYSNASVSEAVNVALQQINVPGEHSRKHIFVILTDGSTQDSMQTASITAAKLQQTNAEIYIIPITNKYLMDELLLYAGNSSKLITNVKNYKKKIANYILLDDSSSVNKDFIKVGKINQPSDEKVTTPLNASLNQPQATSKPDLTVKSTEVNETRHAFVNFNHPPTAINSEAEKEDPNCLIDLIFIMDTSQSVEKAFQKQLEFATALLKRIPSSAFNRRIRVAAISFSSHAEINFRFDEFNRRIEIINALLSLTHSGGGTSSISGINLAIKEIQERGREGVRRMIVLISDGHSQDRWEDLLDAADRLRATNAIVYAITANHDYYFRELELYTGSKWLVYVDAREKRFLDDATLSLLKCQNPSVPISSLPLEIGHVLSNDVNKKLIEEKELIRRKSSIESISAHSCKDDYVDLLFIIDTSTTNETYFNSQKAFVMDLIKMIPLEDFLDRLTVAVIKFNIMGGKVHFGFKIKQTPEDILYKLERLEQTGGGTSSLAAAVETALLEIASSRRSSARLVIVIFSNGNNQDRQQVAQKAALKLRETGGEIYAMTRFKVDEVMEYTGNAAHVYVGDRVNNFTEDISNVILNCERAAVKHALVEGVNSNSLKKRCKYSKMDLEIILDASTSRQQVFEHQRELALSLIERLPIDADETHVAVGINSFTSVPTLRQTLGLGRDKQMVRHAIEDIKYNGGSTFTAQAIELSVQDLERGRRPDAIQVVVLMNDGMSQDPWEKVLEASQLLRATGAELFGVALGENIDLRELKHYIGSTDRIYRDNSTERFLMDVVSLLTGGQDCSIPTAVVNLENTKISSSNFDDQICSTLNLDIIIFFDNAIKKANLSEQSISSNRYLLLDVLGSIPITEHSDRVKITVIAFNNQPELVVNMKDLKDRDSIFTKVESITPKISKSSYAKAINFAIREYNKRYTKDVRGIFVIVGDGLSDDSEKERNNAIENLRTTRNLSKYAVDSGKSMDVDILSRYTGSTDNIFNYDRNAEFARVILNAAEAVDKARCIRMSPRSIQFSTVTTTTTITTAIPTPTTSTTTSATVTTTNTTTIRSSSRRSKQNEQRKKDIASKLESNSQQFEDEKVIMKKKTITTTHIPRPTKKSVNRKVNAKEQSVRAINKMMRKNETLSNGKNRKEKQLKEISKSSKLRTTQTTPTFSSRRQLKNTTLAPRTTTIFTPGCKIDAIMLIDSSGSVEKAFNREKELAAEIINRLRIGPENARVAIIKFAAKEKVKTVWSFDKPQEKEKVLQALQEIRFSSGITATHAALLQAIKEYSSANGARPQQATPFVIIFTDGFGQKDITQATTSLRNLIPNIFAVAVSSQHPVSEEELIKIAGSKDRVFMDNDTEKLFRMLEKILRTC
ncbi:von Willebrand factor type A domain family protein [Acanthocheilonema viteae]